MKVKSRAENTFYIVFSVFLGFWIRQSILLTSRKATEFDVGVNFFPLVLSSGMLILTIILLVKNLWTMKQAQEPGSVEEAGYSKSRTQLTMEIVSFFMVLIMLVLYILMLRPLGFGAATFIFLVLMNLMISRFTYGHFLGLKAMIYRIAGFAVFAFGLPYIFRHVFRLILP
jgi:hypothetical protein